MVILWLTVQLAGDTAQELVIAYVAIVVVFLAAVGSYRSCIRYRAVSEAPVLAACIGLPAVAFAALLPDGLDIAALLPRLPVAFLILLAGRSAFHRLVRLIRARGMLLEPTLIVGSGEVGVRIANVLADQPESGMAAVGFLDRFGGQGLPLPLLGDIDAFDRVATEFKIRRVIIAFGGHSEAELVPLLRTCGSAGVEVHAVPRFFEFGATPQSRNIDNLWGIPLVHVTRRSLRSSAHWVMRGLTPAQPTWEHLKDRLPGKVSVVIPAVNEAENITWVLERVPDFVHDVVLVDGMSVDGTVARATSVYPTLRVIPEDRRGKGRALRAGFAAALGDYIVMLDADGSMDPAEIGNYLDPLLHGYDFVKGSRCMLGGGSNDLTHVRRAGNWALTMWVNLLFGARFSDLCYGFSAFRRDCLPSLDLQSDGFEIETEMTIRAVKADLRIAEVPSLELCRRHGQSNLRTFRDGQRVLRTLLTERFSSKWSSGVRPLETGVSLPSPRTLDSV